MLGIGTHENMNKVGNFTETIDHRQELEIACPEETELRTDLIGAEQMERLVQPVAKNGYRQYLPWVLKDGIHP